MLGQQPAHSTRRISRRLHLEAHLIKGAKINVALSVMWHAIGGATSPTNGSDINREITRIVRELCHTFNQSSHLHDGVSAMMMAASRMGATALHDNA